MTVHLLVSPDAGRGNAKKAHTTLLEALAAEGADVVDITGASAKASAEAAAQAVRSGAERLVVAGGDGLVHLGLQATAGTDTILGIVPVGTGNDFVRGLDSFPTEIGAATRGALGSARSLDAIKVESASGNHWIASVATGGFSADVNERANRLRFPTGPSRYTVATVAEIPTLTARAVTLTVDGEAHDFNAGLFAVANTGWFGGGMHICPDADPTDGLLDVTVVADVGRIELLRFFRLVFSGKHLTHPKVHSLRGRTIEIALRADGDLELWGDGEPVGPTPTTMTAVPGALRLAY
jgi:diacylglycerol kinase (ATP)